MIVTGCFPLAGLYGNLTLLTLGRLEAKLPATVETPAQTQNLLATFRTLQKIVRNPMEAWPAAVYTDRLVVTRMLGRKTIFVCDPDFVQQVLVDDSESFVKAESMRRSLEPGLGRGILTAEGHRWRLQRRVAAPVFRPAHVNSFLPAMLRAARNLRNHWAELPDGAPLDIAQQMTRVTFEIILDTMLSGAGTADLERLENSIRDFLESTSWTTALSAMGAPLWTPFPGKWRSERASAFLQRTVSERIAERRQTGERRDDLLSLMLDAKDPETGNGLNDIDIRDNILTFIGAGHETTALALTWTFYLLTRHPEVESKILEEIKRVSGGSSLEPTDVAELGYTRQVVQESMRIFPPVAMVVRQSTRALRIGGEHVAAGDNVFVPIYAIHHHRDLWQNPQTFDPDRFDAEAVKDRHRWSYLPFGAGPRICIGMGFALLEAVAILATLLPGVRLSTAPDFQPTPKLRVTMRPAEGMPMRVTKRAA